MKISVCNNGALIGQWLDAWIPIATITSFYTRYLVIQLPNPVRYFLHNSENQRGIFLYHTEQRFFVNRKNASPTLLRVPYSSVHRPQKVPSQTWAAMITLSLSSALQSLGDLDCPIFAIFVYSCAWLRQRRYRGMFTKAEVICLDRFDAQMQVFRYPISSATPAD